MPQRKFWSNSITLRFWDHPSPSWRGVLHFYHSSLPPDGEGEPDDILVEGTLITRSSYPVADDEGEVLTRVTDTLISGAERLGIELRDPVLLAEYDDDDNLWQMPQDWPDLLNQQAERLGWRLPGVLRSGR